MFTRPFTAICQKSGRTKAVSIDVPDGKDKALEAAKEQLPDENIIALIPGQHARNVYTYNAEGMAQSKKPYPELGDVWPTNLPPGF